MEKEEVKERKQDPELVIVDELPKVPIRNMTDDGKEYVLMTKDEALAELIANTRKLLKLL